MSGREAREHTPRFQNRTRLQPHDAAAPASAILNVILVLAIVFTGWATYRLQPWSASASSGAIRQSAIPFADVNPIGVNTFLANEVEVWKRERTMEMVAELGAGWIRQGFHWNEIEPQKGEHWDARYQQDAWAKFDNIVDLAEQHGVRIIARLDQTPEWARPPGTDPHHPPTDHNDFGDFVFEFVSRYEGRISFIQIWNEPNLAQEWGGSIDPAGYASLLEIAATRAREANPDIVILSAPMAMTTENSPRAVDEFSYWQALYDLDIGQWFDIMSANVYGLSDPYHAEPDPGVLNTRRVELLRDLAVRNNDADKAIWFNEYGWNASPPEFPPDRLIWSRVDEAEQAEWTARGIEFADENWDWFGVANIWYFRHVGNISPQSSDYYFRLVDVEFTPRDVYREVQQYSLESNVATAGYHNPLESSVTSIGSWPVRQGNQYRNGFAVRGLPGSSLVIRFEGSALSLALPPGESYGSIRVDVRRGNISPPVTPGGTTIDLDPDATILTIGSPHTDHPSTSAAATYTAIIHVDQGSSLVLDGIEVHYERSYARMLSGAAVSVGALAGVILLRRTRKAP